MVDREKELDEQFRRDSYVNPVFKDNRDGIEDAYKAINKVFSIFVRVSLKEGFIRELTNLDETIWDEGLY